VYRLEFMNGRAARRFGQDLMVRIVRQQPIRDYAAC
jgi:hypothetical protein